MRLGNQAGLRWVCLIGAIGVQSAQADEIAILNWTDYFGPSVISEFSERMGRKVVVDTFLDADEVEGILVGRKSGYDVVVVPTESLSRVVHEGALTPVAKLQKRAWKKADQALWKKVQGAMPEAADYAVPYVWGTTGLAFNIDQVRDRIGQDTPLDSWALIFEPENAAALSDCGISIVDSSEEVVAIVLRYLGRNPQSRQEDDLNAAFGVLEGISPYVRFFDTEQYDALADGEACVAVSWSSEAFGPIIDEGMENYRYVVPKEGSNLWADVFVLPVDGPNPEVAQSFLDYMGEEDVAAANVQWVFGAVRDESIRSQIDDPNFDHPALRLEDGIVERLFVVQTRAGVEKRALERRWRRMVLGM